MRFSHSKKTANFEAFRWNISSSINLFFLKSCEIYTYILRYFIHSWNWILQSFLINNIPRFLFLLISWMKSKSAFMHDVTEFFWYLIWRVFFTYLLNFFFSLTVWDMLLAAVFMAEEVVSIPHNLTIPDENRVFLPILDIWCHFRSREEIRRKWKIFVKTTWCTKIMDNNNNILKEKNF